MNEDDYEFRNNLEMRSIIRDDELFEEFKNDLIDLVPYYQRENANILIENTRYFYKTLIRNTANFVDEAITLTIQKMPFMHMAFKLIPDLINALSPLVNIQAQTIPSFTFKKAFVNVLDTSVLKYDDELPAAISMHVNRYPILITQSTNYGENVKDFPVDEPICNRDYIKKYNIIKNDTITNIYFRMLRKCFFFHKFNLEKTIDMHDFNVDAFFAFIQNTGNQMYQTNLVATNNYILCHPTVALKLKIVSSFCDEEFGINTAMINCGKLHDADIYSTHLMPENEIFIGYKKDNKIGSLIYAPMISSVFTYNHDLQTIMTDYFDWAGVIDNSGFIGKIKIN